MNAAAERHVEKARTYLAKGDEFYRKAKPEIEAAIAAGASQREVARALVRSLKWVQDVIAWDGEGTLYGKDTAARNARRIEQVLRDPQTAAKLVTDALENEDVRQAVLSTDRGLSAVGRASIEAQTRHPRPRETDPLPAPSAFASTFWRAVRYVDDAHEQMTRYGVGSLDLELDAREAALRLQRKASEISAAVAEAFVEDSFTGKEA